MKLTELLKDYRAFYRRSQSISATTIGNYVSKARCLLKFMGPDAVAADWNPQTIKRYLLQVSEHTPKSFANYMCALKHFAAYLHSEGWIGSAAMPDLPSPSVEAPRRIPPSNEEITTLFDACDRLPGSEYKRTLARAILSVLVYGALRRAEVISLTLEDFDSKNRCLRVWCGKNKEHGTAPLCSEAVQALRDYVKVRPASKHTRLFLQSAEIRMGGEGIRMLVKRLQTVAGLKTLHLTPHLFRHAYITRAQANGVPLAVVQANVRHKRMETTAKYTHITVEHQQAWAHLTGLTKPLEGHPSHPNTKPYIDAATKAKAPAASEAQRRRINLKRGDR